MKRFAQTTVAQAEITIQQERLLPVNGEVTTRVGQEISPVQVVARTAQERDFRILPVSDELRISPSNLKKHLLVKPGDTVESGMVLAQSKGLRKREFTSPVDGVVYEIRNGRVIVQYSTGWIELRAMIEGRIANLIPNRGVIIELFGTRIQAIWSSNKENFGKIKTLANSGDGVLTSFHLNDELADQIIVIGRVESPEVLEKAEKTGIRGLITGSIPAELIPAVKQMPFPVLITEGFGRQPMSPPILQLLQQGNGRLASLFGKQRDRQNNRPEIIIPQKSKTLQSPPTEQPSLTIGQYARILRAPYASQVGEIIRIYNNIQKTTIGISAPGADVKLLNGQIVFVPFANLDIIT